MSLSLHLVTIIMPIRNEARHVRQSLNSVLGQEYPSERMEVIVSDGMSADGTREIVHDLKTKHPNLIPIDNPEKIVSTGLNAAIRRAKGEIIIRVDGHTIIAGDYVSQCVSELQGTEAENVGGRMTAVGHSNFGKAVALATSSPFGVGGGRFHYSDKEEWVDTVYMGAWRRGLFERIGLFDEELIRDQDDEFNYRLRSRGGKILLSPRINSKYTVRGNPVSLWRQYFQYGYWKVRVLQKHPRQMRPRQFAPPTFVAVLLSSAVIGLFSVYGQVVLVSIAGTYLAANLLASIWTAVRGGWRSVFLLPLVYAILHLSYGFGLLFGLVKFAHRWEDKQGKVPPFRPVDDQVLRVTRSRQEYANTSQNLR